MLNMDCHSEKPRKKGFTVPSKSKVMNIPCEKDAKERKEEIKTSVNCMEKLDQENKKAKKTTAFHKQTLKETDILKDTQTKGNKLPSSLTDQDYEEIFQSVLKESQSESVFNECESEEKALLVKLSGDDKERANKIKAENLRDLEQIPKKINEEHSEEQEERSKKIKMKHITGQKEKPKKIKKKQSGDLDEKKTQSRTKESGDPKEKVMKIKGKEVDKQDAMISIEDDVEEEGTWIQCTNSRCNKWRYVRDIADPVSVPDLWECSMNPDVLHKSCDDEEEFYDETEQIVTKYTPGSLVWVKMGGFPWWPALVESDPDYDLYFELPNEESMDPVTKKYSSLRLEMAEAVKSSQEALSMSLKERLLKYGFSGRYSSKLKTTKTDTYEYDTVDSEDEDVQQTDNISGTLGKKRKITKKHSDSVSRKKNRNKVMPEIADSACLDQHVPDIMQPIPEEEIRMDFSVNDVCDNIEPQDKVDSLKQLAKNKDIDDIPTQKCISKESLSSADPVPDIDDDGDKNPKEDTEDKGEMQFDLDFRDEPTNTEDKWRYGHFMGHSSDHASDSDPFDIIED